MRPLKLATIALLIVYDLPVAGFLVRGDSLGAQIGREAIFWALSALLVAFVLLVERRPLSSIGLVRPGWRTFAFGILSGVVAIAGIVAVYLVVYPLIGAKPDVGSGTAISALPVWFRCAIVVRAAIFEELYYRGFAIERLTELTGRRWLAAAISFAAFTFAHLAGWGWAHLLVAAVGCAVLTALYLWRRDLACNMLAHGFTDAVGLLLA